MKIHFGLIKIIFFVSLLSGCLATTDLLTQRNGLPDDLHAIALKMVEKAQRICIVMTGHDTPGKDDFNKGEKLSGGWEIKRFFISPDSDWYKAEGVSRHVWDNIYFNKSSGQFICGARTWNKFVNSSSVKFEEFGASSPKLSGVK